MDAPANPAIDQLTGLIGQIRDTAIVHYRTLAFNGICSDVAAEMAAEVQAVLLEVLFPDRTHPEPDDD